MRMRWWLDWELGVRFGFFGSGGSATGLVGISDKLGFEVWEF